MNREDVAMDLTFENLDILRKEVQAAKLLLSECDEIFIEEGISNIELRGYLSGKLSADEVIELLDPPAEQRNQCDGCQAGIPLVDGAHRMGRPGGYPDLMSCQKERYKHPEQAEGAQGEREIDWSRFDPRFVVDFLRHNSNFNADLIGEMLEFAIQRAALAQPSQASAVAPIYQFQSREIGESDWAPCDYGRYQYCSKSPEMDTRVVEVAAQPSPAPALERPEAVDLAQVVVDEVKHSYNERKTVSEASAAIMAAHDRIVGALRAELETERMRLAGCGVAALGYFDGCAEEFKSASLSDVLKLRAERDAAQARVAELEKQEPVAFVHPDALRELRETGRLTSLYPLQSRDSRGAGDVPVFATPVAKAGQVPAEARTKAMQLRVFLGKAGHADQALIAEELMDLLAAAPAQGGSSDE